MRASKAVSRACHASRQARADWRVCRSPSTFARAEFSTSSKGMTPALSRCSRRARSAIVAVSADCPYCHKARGSPSINVSNVVMAGDIETRKEIERQRVSYGNRTTLWLMRRLARLLRGKRKGEIDEEKASSPQVPARTSLGGS